LKPIDSLRRALNAAAHGDLDVRIADNVGRRRDALDMIGAFLRRQLGDHQDATAS